MINKQSKPDLLDTITYCYGYIVSLATDMDIYEIIIYGDSLGRNHYVKELYLCMKAQDIIKELMEEIK